MGKVCRGQITNPTGAPQSGGTISFVETRSGATAQTAPKGSFDVDASGQFKGELPAGTYTAIYRTPGMTPDKQADKLDNVTVVANQDTDVDDDMSRPAYIQTLPEEERKQLEDLKKKNSEAMKANEVIKNLNNDLKTVSQDVKNADAARVSRPPSSWGLPLRRPISKLKRTTSRRPSTQKSKP